MMKRTDTQTLVAALRKIADEIIYGGIVRSQPIVLIAAADRLEDLNKESLSKEKTLAALLAATGLDDYIAEAIATYGKRRWRMTKEGAMSKWKDVSKEEFAAFVKAYPNALHTDITGICEPPMQSYNDFSDGKTWPESMVARITLNTAMKGFPGYRGEPDAYQIKVEEP
jgi:hypothetical protein